jgi:hypothetical protein
MGRSKDGNWSCPWRSRWWGLFEDGRHDLVIVPSGPSQQIGRPGNFDPTTGTEETDE